MTTPLWQPGHLYLTGDLVQPIQAAAPASTALTNPGFESGVITGWTVTTSGAGTSSVASDKKYAGTYAGRWQGVSGGATANWVNATEVAVKPGQSVSAAMYASMDDTGTSANQARVRLYWYDASHAALAGAAAYTDGLLIHGNTSAWYASTVTGIAPAGAAYARMGAWTSANDSGGVRIDSASWSIVAAAAPAGLIYKATQAAPATSAASEPTWPSTVGATVVDGGVTWEGVQASRVVWEASPICLSGATEPTWPTDVGGFVTDGTISWECISRRVEDAKCPNSAVVAIMAGKVFAADGDIVRFCATANPLDWSSADDAGYLPTGLQQANANDMAVLNQYRSNLVAFNASSFQNWQADPDPAAMAILDQMDGIGSTWQHAAQPVANDLFFLSQLGVRSVGIAAGADNLSAGDIGMPIDVLVREAIRVATANGTTPVATYYPGAGQYWLAFSDYPPPGIDITGNLPDGYVGDTVSYSYTAGGGVPPRTFSISAGSLPDGTDMDAAGEVTGQFTATGTFTWTVTVVDADGNSASLVDSATVQGMTISGDLPGGYVGDSGTLQYGGLHGVTPITFSIVSGALPAGATMDSAGLVTYTYSTAGSYAWRVRRTDALGHYVELDDTATVALFTFLVTGVGTSPSGASVAAYGTDPSSLTKLPIASLDSGSLSGASPVDMTGGGKWAVAVRARSYHSATLPGTWVAGTTPNKGSTADVADYGDGVFMVVGTVGLGFPVFMKSTDFGATFTQMTQTTGFGGVTNCQAIAYCGAQDWFASFNNGGMLTADHGASWTAMPSYPLADYQMKDLAYGNGILAAAVATTNTDTDPGKIRISANKGSTFTTVVTTTQSVCAIAKGDGQKWCAACYNGDVYTTEDDWATYTLHAGVLTAGKRYGGMKFNGSHYVTFATTSIYYSSDRTTWSSVNPGLSTLKSIAVGPL